MSGWIAQIYDEAEYLDGITSRMVVRTEAGAPVAYCFNEDETKLIVGAVNSHAALVAERDALRKALRTAIKVADEAREEWDKAPSGMKAGKLLIALSDPKLKYRADITEMHAALSPDASQREEG